MLDKYYYNSARNLMVYRIPTYVINLIVTVFTVTMLFSCQNNFEEVQKVGVLQNQPIGEAEGIDLKYTELEKDTVRLLANLLSPKMLDYSNRNFAFSEFPDGWRFLGSGYSRKVA